MTRFDPNAAAAADSGIFGLPYSPEESALVLVPVAWEATTSYGAGASRGPAAILAASRQIDLHDLDAGDAFEAGIALLSADRELGAWNDEACALTRGERSEAALARVNELSERVNDRVGETAGRWLEAGKLVGVVGGDHSSPFGAIQACARHSGPFGILHLDAHSDTRLAYEGFLWSHASIMRNVLERVPQVTHLVQVGVRDICEGEQTFLRSQGERVHLFHDSQLAAGAFAGETWAAQVERILKPLPERVWLSFDIDGLDPALCPHTGTPVPGGLSFQQAVYLVQRLARSGRRIAGFDLCEVAPGPDGDEWDANVGARLLYKMAIWTMISSDSSGK